MTFRLVLLISRKPGMSVEDFKAHYEDVHVPMMRSLMGDHFPTSHARRYLSTAQPPTGVLKDVDCIAELTWRDKDHFQNFMTISSEASVAAKVAADCGIFMDTMRETATCVVEEYRETTA